MTLTLPTLTLVARELEAITDRLDLLLLWSKAATVPHELRHLPRDLEAARDSIDTTLMDVRDQIADEADSLDRAVTRHPAGRDRDDDAGEPAPAAEVSEFADLAVSALTADADRTRAVLRDIADAGPEFAPVEVGELGTEDEAPPAAALPETPAEADLGGRHRKPDTDDEGGDS